MKRHIRLRGLNGKVKGKSWDQSGLVRIGRQEALEVVLDDGSVSRCHAEIALSMRRRARSACEMYRPSFVIRFLSFSLEHQSAEGRFRQEETPA